MLGKPAREEDEYIPVLPKEGPAERTGLLVLSLKEPTKNTDSKLPT
jgi:hypothetical protein